MDACLNLELQKYFDYKNRTVAFSVLQNSYSKTDDTSSKESANHHAYFLVV